MPRHSDYGSSSNSRPSYSPPPSRSYSPAPSYSPPARSYNPPPQETRSADVFRRTETPRQEPTHSVPFHNEPTRTETPVQRTETPRTRPSFDNNQPTGGSVSRREPSTPAFNPGGSTPHNEFNPGSTNAPAPRREPITIDHGVTQPRHHFGDPTGPSPTMPSTPRGNVGPAPTMPSTPRQNSNGGVTRETTHQNSNGGLSREYTTNRPDGSRRIKTDTTGPNGEKSVRITTVDASGNKFTARTRGVDSWSSRAPEQHYNQAVSTLRNGGSGYHRDVTYSTNVTNRTTVIINNNNYYTPSYYNDRSYGGFGGGFFAGYVAGAIIDAALMGSYYNEYNSYAIGNPYYFPSTVWQPYYRQVLIEPLPVFYGNNDYDYSRPEAWQTPPLDPNRDPLEQLGNFGQLQRPGWFGVRTTISAIEARDRLNKGQEVDVAGVAVTSYDQLARVVPEVARSSSNLTAQQSQVLAAAVAPVRQAPTIEETIANLPTFEKVYSPKSMTAEDEVNGKKINRTMDAASAIYDRPEVKQAIAEWWQANPSADRNALNTQINSVVTSALTSDLEANADKYAATPNLEDNPVAYLQDAASNPDAVAYNKAAIDHVRMGAAAQLQGNLISNANAH
jgi:hypothetical protein